MKLTRKGTIEAVRDRYIRARRVEGGHRVLAVVAAGALEPRKSWTSRSVSTGNRNRLRNLSKLRKINSLDVLICRFRR